MFTFYLNSTLIKNSLHFTSPFSKGSHREECKNLLKWEKRLPLHTRTSISRELPIEKTNCALLLRLASG